MLITYEGAGLVYINSLKTKTNLYPIHIPII